MSTCLFRSINPTVLEIEEYDEQMKPKGIVVEKYLHVGMLTHAHDL